MSEPPNNREAGRAGEGLEIRRATSADALVISRLNAEVQKLHAGTHPELFRWPVTVDFAAPVFVEALAHADQYAYIAYEAGEPVGYIYAARLRRPEDPFHPTREAMYIHHLCVTAARRGRGYGKALVAQVVAQAKALGIERVELDVWSFNEAAQAAFAAMGFAVYNRRMVLQDSTAPRVAVAQEADIPDWLALAAEVEPLFGPMVEDPGFMDALRRNIARGTAFCVREGNGPAGAPLAGGLLYAIHPPVYTIGWLAVAERHRGHGVGRLLMEHAIRLVQPPAEMVVTTFGPDIAEGVPARRLYERMGFHPAEMAEPGPEGGSRQIFRRFFSAE